jgi:hypothetical protein
VEKLLAKYSLSAFKEGTAQFWRVLRRAQKPTKLERVLQDIDEGKIPWEDSDEEEEATLASEASKRAAAASNSEGKGDAKPKEKEKEEGPKWLTLTAWELRQVRRTRAGSARKEEGTHGRCDCVPALPRRAGGGWRRSVPRALAAHAREQHRGLAGARSCGRVARAHARTFILRLLLAVPRKELVDASEAQLLAVQLVVLHVYVYTAICICICMYIYPIPPPGIGRL